MPALEYNATLIQRLEIAPGLVILRVVPDVLPFRFEPGQYTVSVDGQSAGFSVTAVAGSGAPSGMAIPVLVVIIVGGLLVIVLVIVLLMRQRSSSGY